MRGGQEILYRRSLPGREDSQLCHRGVTQEEDRKLASALTRWRLLVTLTRAAVCTGGDGLTPGAG